MGHQSYFVYFRGLDCNSQGAFILLLPAIFAVSEIFQLLYMIELEKPILLGRTGGRNESLHREFRRVVSFLC